MSAVKVAATVPQKIQDGLTCPTAQLVSWGVPVKRPSQEGSPPVRTTFSDLPEVPKDQDHANLLAVERRLSVKLDKLIEKVDRLSATETSPSSRMRDLRTELAGIEDGDERRNRTSSESSLLPDARKRTSSDNSSLEKEKRTSSSESTDKSLERDRRRTSSESTEKSLEKERTRTSSGASSVKSRESFKRSSSERELEQFLPPTRTEKIFAKTEVEAEEHEQKSPPAPPPAPVEIVHALPVETEGYARARACDKYQIDFSAKSFGLCVCGHYRKDHGKRTSVSGNAPVSSTNRIVPNKPTTPEPRQEIQPPPLLRQDSGPRACDKYQIDFSAKSFGLCVCGHYRKDHGTRTSISGVVERPESLRPTSSATSQLSVSDDGYSSREETRVLGEADDSPEPALSIAIMPPDTVAQRILGEQLEEKGEKQSPASVTGVFQKPSRGTLSSNDWLGRTAEQEEEHTFTYEAPPEPCGAYKADFHAEQFGICVCGFWKADHNKAAGSPKAVLASAKPTADISAGPPMPGGESADAAVDVYPEIKDLPEYRPYLDMIKSGVEVDTIAKKMRIKGLDPKKLHVGQDPPSEPKTSSPSQSDRGKSIYGISVLKGTNPPPDVDQQNKEQHLSDAEFIDAFGMYREEFVNMAKWRRIQLKKSVGLF
jgi:hypothetical protein